MTAQTWTETFYIHSYEIDPRGTATIKAICNYLQEIAGDHASHLGVSVDRLMEDNQTWVLSRLHLEMDQLPRWKQEVTIETWPSGENGLLATREFILSDEQDARLGRATSAWLIIDVDRRRPVRIPDYITDIRLPDRGRVLPAPEELPGLEKPQHESTFHVRYSDLDLNGHVNNVHYAEWAIETLPDQLLQTLRLTSVEIHFQAETERTDTVLGQAEEIGSDPRTYLHRLIRTHDHREVARLRSRWAEPEN